MSEDIMIRGLLAENAAKFIAISGRALCEKARITHGLSRVCTAALGRTLLMSVMMGAQLKDGQGRVTTIIRGGGPAGNVVCTANAQGQVKGYIENPALELPLGPDGKLDVSTAVGWFGGLTVVRDMGLKEPYTGTCNLVSGEIAEDFAQYYAISEQQPSLVYLGVRVDSASGEVRSAGGLVIQPLPQCPEEVLDQLQNKVEAIRGLAAMLEEMELTAALAQLFSDMNMILLKDQQPVFQCDCSRERLEQVILSLGKSEILDMMEKEHGAEITCQFCNQKYGFSEARLGALLEEAEKNDE